MDSVTQAVLGAAIGEAGFRHKLGGRAVFFGAVCGTLPDLDVVAGLAGEWQSLIHHRGVSHSLIALSLVSPAVGWVGWRLAKRQGRPTDWMLLAFLALVTHPLLDTCTAYGTQLLAPLSRVRFAIDAVSIIDPIYTVPLLVAVALASIRHVPRALSQRFAAAALAATTLYLGFGYLQSQRALAEGARQLAAQGFEATKVRALPTLMNVWAFRIVARDDEGDLRVGHLSLFEPRDIAFHALERPRAPVVERALESEEGQVLQWFADELTAVDVEADGERTVVRVADARYGGVEHPTRFLWGASFVFDGGALVDASRWNRRDGIEPRAELEALWGLIAQGRPGRGGS